MIEDLKALAAAARKAGKPLAVRSAYRSYDYQKSLFDSYVRTYGYAQALKFSARPGHSEHQMGTTVDFTAAPGRAALDEVRRLTLGQVAGQERLEVRLHHVLPQGQEERPPATATSPGTGATSAVTSHARSTRVGRSRAATCTRTSRPLLRRWRVTGAAG